MWSLSTAASALWSRRRPLRLLTAACVAAAMTTVATGACSSHNNRAATIKRLTATTAIQAAAANVTGTLDVIDQLSNGTSFRIEAVTIDGSAAGGFVALHADDHGKLGAVVGSVHIGPGLSRAVAGTLTGKHPSGAYWAALHVDDHTPNVFEYGTVKDADLPVRSGDDVVRKLVTLTVR